MIRVRLSLGGTGRSRVAAVVAVAAVAGCGASPSAGAASGEAAAGGQCRYVTAAEVAEATGLPAVKPTETQGPCNYLLNPADVMPSLDPRMTSFPPLPPALTFVFYTDAYPVSAVVQDLQRPGLTPVPGLDGVTAGSFTGPDGEYEFVAKLTGGAVRISVDPPRQFRTGDLTTVAVRVFKFARPRMS